MALAALFAGSGTATAGTSVSFNFDCGAASTDKIAVIGLHQTGGPGGKLITAITVDGVDCLANVVQGQRHAMVWVALPSSSGVITVNLTYNSAPNFFSWGGWTVLGSSGAPTDTQSTFGTDATKSLNMTIPSGGIGLVTGTRNSTTAITTTNATEDYDAANATSHRYIGAHTTATGSISPQFADVSSMVGFAFGPDSSGAVDLGAGVAGDHLSNVFALGSADLGAAAADTYLAHVAATVPISLGAGAGDTDDGAFGAFRDITLNVDAGSQHAAAPEFNGILTFDAALAAAHAGDPVFGASLALGAAASDTYAGHVVVTSSVTFDWLSGVTLAGVLGVFGSIDLGAGAGDQHQAAIRFGGVLDMGASMAENYGHVARVANSLSLGTANTADMIGRGAIPGTISLSITDAGFGVLSDFTDYLASLQSRRVSPLTPETPVMETRRTGNGSSTVTSRRPAVADMPDMTSRRNANGTSDTSSRRPSPLSPETPATTPRRPT